MLTTRWYTWLRKLPLRSRAAGRRIYRRARILRPTFEHLETRCTPVVTNLRTGFTYETVQAAIDDANTVANDTLQVSNGTYFEANTTVTKAVTIQGESRDGVIFAPQAEDSQDADDNFTGNFQIAFIIQSDGVTIRNLTIDGDANPLLTSGKRNFRAGIATDQRLPGNTQFNNLQVENVSFDAIFRRAVQIFDSSTGHIITGNSVTNMGRDLNNPSLAQAFAIFGADVTITNNTIDDAAIGIGINANLGSQTLTNPLVVVTGNTISNVFDAMNLASLAGGSRIGGPSSTDGNTINLVDNFISRGIVIGFLRGPDVVVQNNTITASEEDTGIVVNNIDTADLAPLIIGNTLTATNSIATLPGDGTGILLTDDETVSFNNPGPAFAIIQGNTITNFFRGIDLLRTSTDQPGGFEVNATIGGLGLGQGNTITYLAGGPVGVRLFDADGAANELRAIATLVGNTITGSDVLAGANVEVNGGSLTQARRNILRSSGIGINVTNGGTVGAIQENTITDHGGAGITVEATAGPVGPVFNNDLSGNAAAILNQTSSLLDASGNWYGSNVAANVAAAVGLGVDYSPFLNVGIDTDPSMPGFQGDFSVLHVDAASPQVGIADRIQEGINLAAGINPLAVILEAGTYSEAAVVNKTLTLRGRTGTAADVLIQLPLGDTLTVVADAVTVQDLTVTGGTGGSALRADNVTGITLSNVRLVNSPGNGLNLNNVSGTINLFDLTITGNLEGGTIGGNNATVDFLTTTGTVDDVVSLTPTQVQLTRGTEAQQPLNYANVTLFGVRGDAGNDTFNVIASPNTAYNIDGGPPTIPPGDTLVYDAQGRDVTVNVAAGVIASPGVRDVTFTNIETRRVLNSRGPIANNDSFTTPEGVALNVPAPGVLANDVSPDTSPLSAAVVTLPTNGTLTLNADGSFVYTPNANFSGTDTFTYSATNDSGTSPPATVTITVTAAIRPPVANNDAFNTAFNTPLTVDAPGVLANDTDPQNLPLTAILVSSTTNGQLTLNPNGSFSYTPNAGFSGTDSFTYRASNGTLQSNVATVSITVAARPILPPVANDDSFTTPFDNPLTVVVPGVLANDTDPQNLPLTVILVTTTVNGQLVLNANGSFTYTPNAGFSGTDSFTYRASNGTLQSNVAAVAITVSPNQPPVANDDAFTTQQNTPLNVPAPGVLANDADPEGRPLTATLVNGTVNGTLTLNPNGSFTYTPNTGFVGTDSFTYRANDGNLNSNVATVTITVTTVTPPTQPPVVGNPNFTVPQGTTKVPAPGVLTNVSNPGNLPLTAILVTQPVGGTVLLDPDGGFAFTAAPGFSGVTTFTFRAVSGQIQSNIGTVTLTVTPDTPNSAYVRQLYRDVLMREGEPAGVQFWVGLLESGTFNRTQVATGFVTSPEYRNKVLDQIYRQYLDREPDDFGRSQFLALLERGGTFDQVRNIVIGSAEYFSISGRNPRGFLENLYNDALGRGSDPVGLAFWLDQINNQGRSTFEVGFSFLRSREYLANQVNFNYRTYLRREAEPAGFDNHFTRRLIDLAYTEERMLVSFLDSPEYFTLAGGRF